MSEYTLKATSYDFMYWDGVDEQALIDHLALRIYNTYYVNRHDNGDLLAISDINGRTFINNLTESAPAWFSVNTIGGEESPIISASDDDGTPAGFESA